jgi:DNA replication protein DnaC
MMIEQTIDKLYEMKLDGMVEVLREQMNNPASHDLPFEDRLSLLVDRQWDLKESRGLRRRLQVAHLRQQAAIEDVYFDAHRGLEKASLLRLAQCGFIRSHSNIIITGPTGAGKTYIACAIGHRACRMKHAVRYFGCGDLLSTAMLARADGSYTSFMRRLAGIEVLAIDDWGLYPLDHEAARDMFEILESRSGRGSTIIVSQIPVDDWHQTIAGPTIADAILDRLVHNAYRIEMKGESMRKRQSPLTGSDN